MALIRSRIFGKKGDRKESTEASLLDVGQSLTRSLSSRAQRLSRRVSSIRSEHHLCSTCLDLDFSSVFSVFKSDAGNLPALDGFTLGELKSERSAASCTLCRILSQVSICSQLSEPILRVQLRAFPLLHQVTGKLDRERPGAKSLEPADFFLAAVPGHFLWLPGGLHWTVLNNMLEKQGYLLCHRIEAPRLFIPRLISPDFNPAVAKDWLHRCKTHHSACSRGTRRPVHLRLINCKTRQVVEWDPSLRDGQPPYVALSYVWAKNSEAPKAVRPGLTFPSELPRVVEDAISVTTALDYEYLWIDKFCVDQQDHARKNEQIRHMDVIYQNADLTVIAAAGPDETYGLPGVSRPRPRRQVNFQGSDFTLTSTLPSPHNSIKASRWATRAWTYQEAILSTRRLVFTDEQLYFECNSASCAESLELCPDGPTSADALGAAHWTRPRLFGFPQLKTLERSPLSPRDSNSRLPSFLTYMHCAEQYSARTLSFDEDSLNAFTGIIRHLESTEAWPVRHIWGIPLFHPDDDTDNQTETDIDGPTTSAAALLRNPFSTTLRKDPFAKDPESCLKPSIASIPGEVDYLGFLLAGLAWRHPATATPRRRNALPSWSWVGWEGAVAWPRISPDDGLSSVRSPSWPETIIYVGDGSGSRASVPASYHMTYRESERPSEHAKTLYIETTPASRDAFLLDEGAAPGVPILRLSNGGAAVRLYPSKPGLGAAKAFRRLQSGRYEAVRLAVVRDDAYLMLVKRYRRVAYRVGTMVVKDIFLEAALFGPSRTTYKLR
ncbi:heterokaryon incompatibility protein-domain-containing protein [Xylariaceae sp. FL0804]|nr:heterokaryon incompatibility protein-domain-containing protein [Xylariaceae sp. FL0804]